MELQAGWEYVADKVMGGVSRGQMRREAVDGREAARLTGTVSLDNDGGFIQMAFDLGPLDVSAWTGIEIDVIGNGERYDMRLRTQDLTRPWQSYRTEFVAPQRWNTIQLPFSEFEAHRTEAPLALDRLRRIGVLAIGRVFDADVSVAAIRLY